MFSSKPCEANTVVELPVTLASWLAQGQGTAWPRSRSCIVAGVSDEKPQTRGAAGKARVKRGLDRVRQATAAAAPTAQKTVKVVRQGASVAHRFFRDAGRATSKTTSEALEGVVQRARSSVGETNESAMRFLATRYRDSRLYVVRVAAQRWHCGRRLTPSGSRTSCKRAPRCRRQQPGIGQWMPSTTPGENTATCIGSLTAATRSRVRWKPDGMLFPTPTGSRTSAAR